MKNFRGSALAAGVGTPESVPHELLRSSLFYLGYKHRNCVTERSTPHVALAVLLSYKYDACLPIRYVVCYF